MPAHETLGGPMHRALLIFVIFITTAVPNASAQETGALPVEVEIPAELRPAFEAMKVRLKGDPIYAPEGSLTDADVLKILAFEGWIIVDGDLRRPGENDQTVIRITRVSGAMPRALAESWVASKQATLRECPEANSPTRLKALLMLRADGSIESARVIGTREAQRQCVLRALDEWRAPRMDRYTEVELDLLFGVPASMRNLISRGLPQSARAADDFPAAKENSVARSVPARNTTQRTEPSATSGNTSMNARVQTVPTDSQPGFSLGAAITTAVGFLGKRDTAGRSVRAGAAFLPLNLEVEAAYRLDPARSVNLFWTYQVVSSRDEINGEDAFSGPCLGGECIVGGRYHGPISGSWGFHVGAGVGATRHMVQILLRDEPECIGATTCESSLAVRSGWLFPQAGLDHTWEISSDVQVIGFVRMAISVPEVVTNLHAGLGTRFDL